jgi:hypothetical protein
MATNKLRPPSDNALTWDAQALPMEGRATFLPFQDTGGKRSLALPGVLAAAINAITAPKRAYTGSDPNFDPQEEASNFAMSLMGGGMGASRAAPAPAGSVGMFIGKKAKTWDAIAAARAAELEKAGVDAKTIWTETGTLKGADGLWRQEIPDVNTGFRGDFNYKKPNTTGRYEPFVQPDMPLGGAFNHPELYKAYPELLRTERMDVVKRSDWVPESGNIGSYRSGQISVRDKTEAGAKSTALHELQHAVQQIEGFQPGGSSSQFYGEELLRLMSENPRVPESRLVKAAGDAAFARYLALTGEVEARATQARGNLTAAERRNLPPK